MKNLLEEDYISTYHFRSHNLEEDLLVALHSTTNRYSLSEQVALYLLEQECPLNETTWKESSYWKEYLSYCEAIWEDIQYFPIPESTINQEATVSYVNTWGDSREYGGERLHEGTDIMAAIDTPGLYPVISVSDGVVTKMGWLEQGGYRIGITGPSGGYFYYAHLDSYSAIEIGDEIQAGDILGYMGDSGYGEEGTTGMFPVHLHFGIYLNVEGEEISINPYWILRFLEIEKLKYSF